LRIFGSCAKRIFVLCLPILLLTASLGWAVNSHWLYNYGSIKYNVRQSLSNSELELTGSELEKIYAGLITYFNSNEEYISLKVMRNGELSKLFTPEEVIHFRDVKGLIWLDYWLLLGTLLYVLGYTGISILWQKRRCWHRLAWGVVGGSSITLALMLALGLGTLLGFGQLFYHFHLFFFDNPHWSAEGFMLLLFPERFFYDVTLFCTLAIVGMTVILGGVAAWYLLFTRSGTTSQ